MFFRQPTKLALSASNAPSSLNTASGGANHTAMKTGTINPRAMSQASRIEIISPIVALARSGLAPSMTDTLTPVTRALTTTIASNSAR